MPTQEPDFINFKSTSKVISTNAEMAMRENGKRRYLLIQNIGSVSAYVAFGDTRGPSVSSTTGIKIGAGEAYEMQRGAGNVNSEKVYATAASTNTTLLLTEGAYEGDFTSFAPPPAGASSSSSSSSSSSVSSSSSSDSSSSST